MDVVKLLGKNVRDLRRARELSQEELAHRADMDRSYVSDLERGVRNPSVRALGRLAQALDVLPSRLLEPRSKD
jgi:transcriptional regulator with XRE-family HTH domain